MKTLGFLLIAFITTIGMTSCSKKEGKTEVVENAAKTEAAPPAPPKPARLPDPSGTYADSEGMMTYEFYSTGKFYMTLLGDPGSGTWERVGNTIELTDEETGMSAGSLEIGNDELIWPNGKRLIKQ